MSALIKVRVTAFCLMTALLMCGRLQAQISSTTGSATTSWGNYSWQVDQAPVTTTITAVLGISNANPNLAPDIQVNIPASFTVHEVHGNYALAAWATFDPTSTCGMGNGSVIGEVRDQAGNNIAAVKLQVLGPGTTNVPISGTFVTPLSVSILHIILFADQCGAQTIEFSLVMS